MRALPLKEALFCASVVGVVLLATNRVRRKTVNDIVEAAVLVVMVLVLGGIYSLTKHQLHLKPYGFGDNLVFSIIIATATALVLAISHVSIDIRYVLEVGIFMFVIRTVYDIVGKPNRTR